MKTSIFKDLIEGFQYVRRWKGLLTLMVFSMIGNLLFNPAITLTPLLVTEHFKGGASELGWLQTSIGVGMITGSLALGAWGGFRKRMFTVMGGGLGAGISALLVAFAPPQAFWLGVIGFFLLGSMLAMLNAPINAIFQSQVAPEMQGRVVSLISSAAQVIAPIGMAIAGPLSDVIGVRPWFVIAGGGMLFLMVIGFYTPALMNLETQGGQIDELQQPASEV